MGENNVVCVRSRSS